MRDSLVYLIILNWNGLNDTLECLESVYAVDYPNFRVIVVDNGSIDDSCREVSSRYPDAVLIRNGENLGFAEGNNVGIRFALKHGAEYIFLLNNDTVVDSQILKELCLASQELNDRAVLGAQIYYYSEPEKIWYAGAEWDSANSVFHHIKDELCKNAVVMTDYACGCALFFSAGISEEIGFLESKYFLTFEETDWCYRAKRAGIDSYCVANAKVYHKISTSFGGSASPLMSYFLTRNSLLWGERHLSLSDYIKLVIITLRRIVWMSSSEAASKFRIINHIHIFKQYYEGKYDSVVSYSYYLGCRDYLLRKFGNGPSNRSLLMKSVPSP